MVSSPVSAGSQVFAHRRGWDSVCWTCASSCCSSQVWLFKQKPEYLDSLVKYHSCTTGLGRCYVEPRKMDVDEDTAEKFYQKLLELEEQTLEKYHDLLD